MMKTMWLTAIALVVSMFGTVSATAQRQADLTPFLQSELNEISLLTAQANYLQQQGDPLGAGVVASYIPDHRMQAIFLSSAIQSMGGNPATVVATGAPVLGTREQIIVHDMRQHEKVVEDYRELADDFDDNATVQFLAMNGVNGAIRHHASLQIAKASTTGDSDDLTRALRASLLLERAAISDLQVQAARLNTLGESSSANALLAFVPAHQTQATSIEAQLHARGSDPGSVVAPQVVVLPTREQILLHEQIGSIQFINTYALPIASLPLSNSLRQVAMQGQSSELVALSRLQGMPPVQTVAARQ